MTYHGNDKPLLRLGGDADYTDHGHFFPSALMPGKPKPMAREAKVVSSPPATAWEEEMAHWLFTRFRMRELRLPAEKVNVHGGASGARIIATLLHAMRQRHSRRGVASLCIGGGEATAIALEAM